MSPGGSRPNAGGRRPGAGRPKKPLVERLADGGIGKRPVTVLAFPDPAPQLPPPAPSDRLGERARALHAEAVAWLQPTGCLHLIPPLLIEEYADNLARAWDCSKRTPRSYLVVDRRTGNRVPSPYIKLAHGYAERAAKAWHWIWAVIRENCQQPLASRGPHEDAMARLLQAAPPKKEGG